MISALDWGSCAQGGEGALEAYALLTLTSLGRYPSWKHLNFTAKQRSRLSSADGLIRKGAVCDLPPHASKSQTKGDFTPGFGKGQTLLMPQNFQTEKDLKSGRCVSDAFTDQQKKRRTHRPCPLSEFSVHCRHVPTDTNSPEPPYPHHPFKCQQIPKPEKPRSFCQPVLTPSRF